MSLHYVIPGQPVTKKNSMRMVTNKKTGRMFPMPSLAYKTYEAEAEYMLRDRPSEPISQPVEVTCHYYLGSRRKCDLTNLMEATHDILVKCKVLADDNYTVIVSVDGSRCFYDKENPRTEIFIKEIKE